MTIDLALHSGVKVQPVEEVESDEEPTARWRSIVDLLHAAWFNWLLMLANVVNCVLIGFDTDCKATSGALVQDLCGRRMDLALLISEIVFLVTFGLELFLRVLGSWRYLCTGWGSFDIILVVVSVTSLMFLLQPREEGNELAESTSRALTIISALRVGRLFRIVRNIQYAKSGPSFILMVKALLTGIATVFSALMLGVLIMFVFAVVGVKCFSSLGEGWSSVGPMMLTLLQIATFDDWSQSVQPVLQNYPGFGHLYVFSYFTLVAICLMPLVTAVLVSHSMMTAKNDRKMKDQEREDRVRRLQRDLQELMVCADRNSDGDVSKQELLKLWNSEKKSDEKARSCLKQLGAWEEIEELFDLSTGCDPLHPTVDRDVFLQNLLLYKKDKVAFLVTVALENLGTIRRKVVRLESKLDGTRCDQRNIAHATHRGCLSKWLLDDQRAHEYSTARSDNQRARRLKRAFGCDVDVKALRQVFETADDSKEGIIDKDEFAKIWQDMMGSRAIGNWKEQFVSADVDGSGGIDFDEFLMLVCARGWHKTLGAVKRPGSINMELLEDELIADATRSDLQVQQNIAKLAAQEAASSVAQQLSTLVAAQLRDLLACASQEAARPAAGSVDRSLPDCVAGGLADAESCSAQQKPIQAETHSELARRPNVSSATQTEEPPSDHSFGFQQISSPRNRFAASWSRTDCTRDEPCPEEMSFSVGAFSDMRSSPRQLQQQQMSLRDRCFPNGTAPSLVQLAARAASASCASPTGSFRISPGSGACLEAQPMLPTHGILPFSPVEFREQMPPSPPGQMNVCFPYGEAQHGSAQLKSLRARMGMLCQEIAKLEDP